MRDLGLRGNERINFKYNGKHRSGIVNTMKRAKGTKDKLIFINILDDETNTYKSYHFSKMRDINVYV